jgi:organic radical activating enzyme
MLNNIKLIECFRTFQGEGPDSGRAMMLLRFKHCDRSCFFCDTAVKMRISEEGCYTINQIQKYLDQYRCGLMITGGEPTFSPHYKETLTLLTQLRYTVANVETNGCQLKKMLREKDWMGTPVKFIYSPKILGEDSLREAKDLTEYVLSHPYVYIKIPYLKNSYVDYYCGWLQRELNNLSDNDHKVWVSPVGATEAEQKKSSADVMDVCERYMFNFSGRTHIMYDFL